MGILSKLLALLASFFIAGSAGNQGEFENTDLPTGFDSYASDIEMVTLPEDLVNELKKGDVLVEIKNAVMSFFYKEVEEDKLISGANAGLVSMTGDIANMYFPAQSAEMIRNWPDAADDFTGVWLGRNRDNNWCVVTSVAPGSSAEKEGIQVGDIVYSLDDIVVTAADLPFAQMIMNGEKDSKLKVVLVRDYEEVEAELVRDTEQIACNAYMLKDKIGYLGIMNLDSGAVSSAVSYLLENQPEVLIVDLRGVNDNELEEVRKIAGNLLGETVIAKKQGKDGEAEEIVSEGEGLDVSYVVLVDEYTSDGGEILAQALRENRQAVLVGKHTFGNTPELAGYDVGDDLVFIAKARYLSREGIEIHGNGLDVDIEAELDETEEADGDSQVNAALEYAEEMIGEEAES